MMNNIRRVNRHKFTNNKNVNTGNNNIINNNTSTNNTNTNNNINNNSTGNQSINNTNNNTTNNTGTKLNKYQTKNRVILCNFEEKKIFGNNEQNKNIGINELANYLKISPNNLFGMKVDKELKIAILYFRNKHLATNCVEKNNNLAIFHQTSITEFKYNIKLDINEENIQKVWNEFNNPENHDNMGDEAEKTNTKIVSMNIVTSTKYWSIHTNRLVSEKLTSKLQLTRDLDKSVSFIISLGENINIRHDELEKSIEEQWKIKPKITFSSEKKTVFAIIPTNQLASATITREIYFENHIFKNVSFNYYKKKNFKIKYKQMQENLKKCNEENEILIERLDRLEDQLATFTIDIKNDYESRITYLEQEMITKPILKEEIELNNAIISKELDKQKLEIKESVSKQLQINNDSLIQEVNTNMSHIINQNFLGLFEQLKGLGVSIKPNQ